MYYICICIIYIYVSCMYYICICIIYVYVLYVCIICLNYVMFLFRYQSTFFVDLGGSVAWGVSSDIMLLCSVVFLLFCFGPQKSQNWKCLFYRCFQGRVGNHKNHFFWFSFWKFWKKSEDDLNWSNTCIHIIHIYI